MSPDLVSAKYIEAYKVQLQFADGKQGVVDFQDYLNRGGVFSKFSNPSFFQSFSVHPELRVLTWGEEIDISPETLYAKATGAALPAWTEN